MDNIELERQRRLAEELIANNQHDLCIEVLKLFRAGVTVALLLSFMKAVRDSKID